MGPNQSNMAIWSHIYLPSLPNPHWNNPKKLKRRAINKQQAFQHVWKALCTCNGMEKGLSSSNFTHAEIKLLWEAVIRWQAEPRTCTSSYQRAGASCSTNGHHQSCPWHSPILTWLDKLLRQNSCSWCQVYITANSYNQNTWIKVNEAETAGR